MNTASPGALTRKWDVFWNTEYEQSLPVLFETPYLSGLERVN